jgi:hypothetical protein
LSQCHQCLFAYWNTEIFWKARPSLFLVTPAEDQKLVSGSIYSFISPYWILVITKVYIDLFLAPYIGRAMNTFHEYLIGNNQRFLVDQAMRLYYEKFHSIIQSSGTGKSKLLIKIRIMTWFI